MCFELCPYPYFSNGYLPWSLPLLKTFSCLHVLFIKCLISTTGSHAEWQKNASWQCREREQKEARRYLFLPIQNIEIQFLAGHMSQRKQLLAAVDLRGSSLISVTRVSLALLRHVWEWVGMMEWPCSSLPRALALGGPVSDGRKNDRLTLWKIFFVVDGHSLIIAAPGFLLFLFLSFSLGGVLVNQLSNKGKKRLWFVVFANFHGVITPTWATNPALLNMELGRQETYALLPFVGLQGPGPTLRHSSPIHARSSGAKWYRTVRLSFYNSDFRIWFVKYFCICWVTGR